MIILYFYRLIFWKKCKKGAKFAQNTESLIRIGVDIQSWKGHTTLKKIIFPQRNHGW